MDIEKQRQYRCSDARLTESRNARSEQLLMVPTESLTNREWLPGELLSGSERRKPGWFLDVKYQTCSVWYRDANPGQDSVTLPSVSFSYSTKKWGLGEEVMKLQKSRR